MGSNKNIIIILIIAFLIRLAFILYSPAGPYIDFEQYFDLAIRIVQGYGFSTAAGPTAFRAPAYPLLLALFFNITGISLFVAKLVNVLLGTLTVLGTFLVAKAVFNEQIGLVAAIIVALTPGLILYTPVLASENLATPLLLLSLWLVIVGLEKGRLRYFLLGGGCSAVLCLTRPDFLLLSGAFIVYMVLVRIRPFDLLRNSGLLMLGFIIGLAPWTFRNYVVFGKFIPVSTNGGLNLAMGLHDGATGTYTWNVTDTTLGTGFNWDTYRLIDSDMTEDEMDKALRQVAIRFVKGEPVRAISLMFPKLWFLYHEDVSGVYHNTASPNRPTPQWIWTAVRWLAQFYYMVMMAAAFFSLKYFGKLKGHLHILLVGLVILYWTGIHMLFFGTGRFHLPILPLIFLFSSFSLFVIFNRWVRPKLNSSRALLL